jgi:Holliday junction resolvase RusA-like endonuclease
MIRVVAHYPGNYISANHMRYPNSSRIVPEAAAWMDGLVMVLRTYKNHLDIELHPPVNIRLTGRWRNHRTACDYDNLHKSIGDCIQAAIGIDDEHFRWHDGEPEFGVRDQEIVIEIWQGEDDKD